MSNQYIIRFTTNNEAIDGFVELSKTQYSIPYMVVRTHKNQSDESNRVLLYKFMTNNFATVLFDDVLTKCTLSCNDSFSKMKSDYTLTFDSSSSSAYSNFKKHFNEMCSTTTDTLYYPSGRELYIGEVLTNKETGEGVPNGKGTLYYDLHGYRVKYNGEFEGGVYDGSGTFYSMDGKISLVAKNISSGLPTQHGKLDINYSKKKDTSYIKFNEVWEKFKLSDKKDMRNLVMSDTFITSLAKSYWCNDEVSMESLIYQEKSIDEKTFELWTKMNRLEDTLYEMRTEYASIEKRTRGLITRITIFSTSMIIFLGILFNGSDTY